MVFGDPLGSDVPLEEDILKKKIEFVKSWVEWNAINSIQIIKFRGTTGTLHTVPARRTFYITSCYIDARDDSATTGGTVSIFKGASNDRIMSISTTPVTLTGVFTNSLNFSMPIRVEAGETVEFSLSVGISGSAGIQGFEIDAIIT